MSGKSPREPLWVCKVHIAAEFRDWLKKRFPFVHIILVPLTYLLTYTGLAKTIYIYIYTPYIVVNPCGEDRIYCNHLWF
jgi:hypothetical protein